jgi:hypothetical protein
VFVSTAAHFGYGQKTNPGVKSGLLAVIWEEGDEEEMRRPPFPSFYCIL